jgi:GNAT superfamily N-acetyltransferase
MKPPKIETVSGEAIRPHVADLARLRIAVFREYPYLYEGDVAYEEKYLLDYVREDATLVLAVAESGVVGVATAMPLAQAHGPLAAPFAHAGIAQSDVYYFGESVLLKDWRGLGVGHRFFDERERRARELGFKIAAFCAVVRPDDHKRRPADYRPHDSFWARRGFVKRPDLRASFSWREIGETSETEKDMVFWLKALG